MKSPFAVVARCLAVVCVLVSLAWSTSILTLAGYHGLVDPDLAFRVSYDLPLSLYRVIPPSPTFDIALVILCNLLAVLGAALYCRPRSVLFSLTLYLALLCFKQTVPLMAYGVFEFLQLGLFYVVVGNFAAWAFRKDEALAFRSERLVGWFFRGHLAMAYLFAGLSKAVGPQWWNGESMWRALSRTDNSGQRWFNMEWTGHYPLLLQIVGIVTVLMETLYPVAFFRKPRLFIVSCMILLHLGTIATQGLTLFGLTMVSLNVFFLLESRLVDQTKTKLPATAVADLSHAAPAEPSPTPVEA